MSYLCGYNFGFERILPIDAYIPAIVSIQKVSASERCSQSFMTNVGQHPALLRVTAANEAHTSMLVSGSEIIFVRRK